MLLGTHDISIFDKELILFYFKRETGDLQCINCIASTSSALRFIRLLTSLYRTILFFKIKR